MPTIDLAEPGLGLSGPSTFEAAGAAVPISFSQGTQRVTMSPGVLLSNETNNGSDIGTVFGTISPTLAGSPTNAGPGFGPSITVTFSQPVSSFDVLITDGVGTPQSYTIRDEKGDTVDVSTNSLGFSFMPPIEPKGGASTFTITSDNPTEWDFAIDDIGYNLLAPPDTKIPLQPLWDSMNVFNLGLSAYGLLTGPLSPLAITAEAVGFITTFWGSAPYTTSPSTAAPAITPDPNYKQTFLPLAHTIPAITTNAIVNDAMAKDANAALTNLGNAGADEEAISVGLNRLAGAQAANDTTAIAIQTGALGTYRYQVALDLHTYAQDISLLATDFLQAKVDQPIDPATVTAFVNNLKTKGEAALPPDEIPILKSYRLTDAQIDSYAKQIATAYKFTGGTTSVSVDLGQIANAAEQAAALYDPAIATESPITPVANPPTPNPAPNPSPSPSPNPSPAPPPPNPVPNPSPNPSPSPNPAPNPSPVPPNNGQDPTPYTATEQVEINQASIYGPQVRAADMTFIDLSHVGADFTAYGNAGLTSHVLDPYGAQMFSDLKQYLADWNTAQPGITQGVSTPGGPAVTMPADFVLNLVNDGLHTVVPPNPSPADAAFGGAIQTFAQIDRNFLLFHHA